MRTLVTALILSLAPALTLSAQGPSMQGHGFPKHLAIGFAGRWVEPVEDFARNVGYGVGMSFSASYNVPRFEQLALRTELGHHWYGWESKEVQLSPTANRVFVDMRTTNNIFVWTIGPELAIRRGPLQPYVLWQAGFSNFYTSSSVSDDNGSGAFASSTNMDDYGWATEYGGGVRISTYYRGRTRTSIDVGGRMTINGTRDYLRSGDITDNPDGSLSFNTRHTQANFFQFTLGLAISGL